MKLRSAVASLLLASCTAFAFAADNNAFTLVALSGKTIGKTSYTIDKTKNGYKVHARFEYRLNPADVQAPGTDATRGPGGMVTDAQYNFEYSVDPNGNFLSGFTQNMANQMITSLQPNKNRDAITIGQVQAGVQLGSRTLGLPKPDFLVAPDYDPSAIQMLLTSALAHPHADSTYLLIIPGNGQGPAANNNANYVTLQPAADAAGTLDGKPVTLKHYLMNYHVGKADLYTDDAGTLMEADMGPQKTNYVRVKFALTPAQ